MDENRGAPRETRFKLRALLIVLALGPTVLATAWLVATEFRRPRWYGCFGDDLIPIFRTTSGKPWSKVNGVQRFIDAREKLGSDFDTVRKKYSSYTCRHTFAHRMLSGYWNDGAGCSIETLAELIGDTPKVAFDHYCKGMGATLPRPPVGCDWCETTECQLKEVNVGIAAKDRSNPTCASCFHLP